MRAGLSFSRSPISLLLRQPLSIKKSYAGAIQRWYLTKANVATRILQILGLIPQLKFANFWGVPARKSQIRKLFVIINPKIANPQIPWWPSPQIANPHICKEKGSVSDPYPHWFACNTFFHLRKYILDYEMPCLKTISKSNKSSINLKESIWSLYL
jgi:hypothetical protein